MPYSLENNTDTEEKHAAHAYRVEETLKTQAAGSSETSALVSPPCVTASNFTAPLIQLRGMRDRPVQPLMPQF